MFSVDLLTIKTYRNNRCFIFKFLECRISYCIVTRKGLCSFSLVNAVCFFRFGTEYY